MVCHRSYLWFAVYALPLLIAGPLGAQCGTPQGNATLAVGGMPVIGGTVHLGLSGAPLAPFGFALDTSPGPLQFSWGTLCVGPGFRLLVDGFNNPLLKLPASGHFVLSLTIPSTAIPGTTYHLQAAVSDPRAPNGFLALSNSVSITIRGPTSISPPIFFENFEVPNPTSPWTVTNGVWQVGVPTSGPMSGAGGSQKCAATNLAGGYPACGTSTRLVSWYVPLPNVGPGEVIRLNHQVWFSTEDGNDYYQVQVSSDGGQAWANPPCTGASSGHNPAWTQAGADLTSWAGQTVRIGFLFITNNCYGGGTGAFIDDVHVFKGRPYLDNPEGWENGIGPWWHVDNGVWEVGSPRGGPPSPGPGANCAGVLLGGGYPACGTNTSLISPRFQLRVREPGAPPPYLFFQHWISTEAGNDFGVVRVSRDSGCTWTEVSNRYSGNGQNWSPVGVDLSGFAGETIQIAFYFESNNCYGGGSGWLVDDVRIL